MYAKVDSLVSRFFENSPEDSLDFDVFVGVFEFLFDACLEVG